MGYWVYSVSSTTNRQKVAIIDKDFPMISGLFMGFSFISIAELFYFIFIRPCFEFRRSSTKNSNPEPRQKHRTTNTFLPWKYFYICIEICFCVCLSMENWTRNKRLLHWKWKKKTLCLPQLLEIRVRCCISNVGRTNSVSHQMLLRPTESELIIRHYSSNVEFLMVQ